MKIAIVTITDGANYGNRLQNYALQTVLEKLGNEVETLHIRTFREPSGCVLLKKNVKNLIKKLIGRNYGRPYLIRRKRFQAFNDRYVHFGQIEMQHDCAPAGLDDMYDCFVAGSDQVWNGKIRIVRDDLRNHLLYFASPQKRVAYAASFGTNFIDEADRDMFRKELEKFKAISVRENSGAAIVEELIGRPAEVVLDPVMLLTDEEWSSIAKKPAFIRDEKYVLTYLLGKNGDEMTSYCRNIADSVNGKVIALQNEFISEEEVENLDYYTAAPDEFIWLIKNAECVLTDSFHCAAFSILFRKSFFVFSRKATEPGNDMSSRMDTLLQYFSLEEAGKDLIAFDYQEMPHTVYGKDVEERLRMEREHSLQYLTAALNLPS